MTSGFRLPRALRDEWSSDPAWLRELPRLADECAAQWSLELEQPVETPHSLVVPAGDAVLKLNAPTHYEADHEADTLAVWRGHGAVLLLARDDGRRAMLLERCRPGTPLRDADADQQIVVADLLTTLPTTPGRPHPFRLVADEAERWAIEVSQRYGRAGSPFETSLVELAVDVFRTTDRAASVLVNQDLHGGNVLRSGREPWLVIDPKPLVGEAEVNGVGPLRNAVDVADAGRWLDSLSELGYDRERLRGWGVAHALAWGWDERDGWSDWSLEAARTIAAAR